MSSIKFWEGWRVKKLIQTKLPKSCLSSFLELSVQFWQSLRIIIFSCNNISNFLPLKMTATAPPPAEGSWGPSSWVTCTNLQWMLLLTTLAGLLTARSRRSPGSYLPSWGDGGAWVTEGKLKTPGFSQEFGTAGTKKSCRCGRKIFTASPTIKSTERGDLCIWDKGGENLPPFWVRYMEIWPLLHRWAPGALWHFAEQVSVDVGWRLIVNCTFGGQGVCVLF